MKYSNEIKIGALGLIAVALAYFGINYLKGLNVLKRQNLYTVMIENLNGVNVATPVLIQGYKIGLVNKINFDFSSGHGAIVTIDVDSELKIPKDSYITTNMTPLSGAELHLHMGNMNNGVFESGSRIPFKKDDSNIMTIVSEKILPAITKIIPKFDTMTTNLKNLTASKEIPEALKNIKDATNNFKIMTSNVKNQLDSNIPSIMANLRTTSEQAAQFSTKLNAIQYEQFINDLQQTAENAKVFSEQLKSKKGTLGLLLNDESLYKKLDSVAMRADSLLKDLKQNPKRYVHFSVF